MNRVCFPGLLIKALKNSNEKGMTKDKNDLMSLLHSCWRHSFEHSHVEWTGPLWGGSSWQVTRVRHCHLHGMRGDIGSHSRSRT